MGEAKTLVQMQPSCYSPVGPGACYVASGRPVTAGSREEGGGRAGVGERLQMLGGTLKVEEGPRAEECGRL